MKLEDTVDDDRRCQDCPPDAPAPIALVRMLVPGSEPAVYTQRCLEHHQEAVKRDG